MSKDQVPTDWEVIAPTANGEAKAIFDLDGNAKVSVPSDGETSDLDDTEVEAILKERYGVEVTSMISWDYGEADGEQVGFFGYEVVDAD